MKTFTNPNRLQLRRAGRATGWILLVIAAFAAGAAVGFVACSRHEQRSFLASGNAASGSSLPRMRIAALGRIEPVAGLIAVTGPPGDRIVKLYPITPGQKLQEGDPIAELASSVERQRQVEIAELELEELRQQREAVQASGRAKIRIAEAEWQQIAATHAEELAVLDARLAYLREQHQIAENTLRRLEKLRSGKVPVTAEEWDKARLGLAQATAELQAAEASRRKAQKGFEEAQKAAAVKKAAAEAELAEALGRFPLRSAQAKYDLARDQLHRLGTIRAPITGTVLHVAARIGQTTGIEPLLHMADTSRMGVIAEVYEGDIEQLRNWLQDKPVRASIEQGALPRTLRGSIDQPAAIARLIARNRVFALDPRADTDRRVVEVQIILDEADGEIAARFVGMQVTVLLEPQS